MESGTEQRKLQHNISSLTIHGLPKVFSVKAYCSKLLWLTLCSAAFISLFYTSAISLIKYFRYDVFLSFEKKPTNSLALPSVTFCNTNLYNPSMYMNEAPVFQHLPKNCSFTDRKYFANNITREIFQHGCRLFIGTFDAKTSGMRRDMPEYFRFPEKFSILPNIYPCFTLNRNSTLRQGIGSEKNGLQMILYNDEIADHTFANGHEEEPLTEVHQGTVVHIHDTKVHVPISDGIHIPAGFHTHIAIHKNINKRKPSPYSSHCVQTNEEDRQTIFPGKNTQLHCFYSCAMRRFYNRCNGVLMEYRSFMGPKKYPKMASYSASFLNCLESFFKKPDLLTCNCKPLCEQESYEVRVNRNPWPRNLHGSALSNIVSTMKGVNKSNPQEARKYLAKVTVYYEEMTENIFEEKEKYDFSTFISETGGQMGFFLGASLMSFIEIFALVLSYMRDKLLGPKERRTVSTE
ncbi:degenerin del-1-like [Rhopilema esculentum]|uniref:degenerin del-1-like n=1 Tax=Rhopilema esculentum TaxID=499914 RepID=UPI0031DD2E62|eukprot:gene2065-17632_t